MTLVATMLAKDVPNLLATRPPRRGVHVELRLRGWMGVRSRKKVGRTDLKAAMRRLNSVLLVPISRRMRDLRGPIVSLALADGFSVLPGEVGGC
jgi:hypothetical protein